MKIIIQVNLARPKLTKCTYKFKQGNYSFKATVKKSTSGKILTSGTLCRICMSLNWSQQQQKYANELASFNFLILPYANAGNYAKD